MLNALDRELEQTTGRVNISELSCHATESP